MSRNSSPRINCAQCGVHVDAIHVERDLQSLQVYILVECHGKTELMRMDEMDFMQVVKNHVAGVAFENKLEDHSDGQATHQAGKSPAGIPSEAMALRRLR